MASSEQWAPQSLKEALDIMSDLLRHGYNPAGIVKEGVNVDVVRTCCRHLAVPFKEEDLRRADAELKGIPYVPSPRPSVERGRRNETMSSSVSGGSLARDEIEFGGSARQSPSSSPVTGASSSTYQDSSARKRKEVEVVVISDSEDERARATHLRQRLEKGKGVARDHPPPPSTSSSGPPPSGSGSNSRRAVDYTDSASSLDQAPDSHRPPAPGPPPRPLPPQQDRGIITPMAAASTTPKQAPPGPCVPIIPAPGQKLTKGQKKARRRDLEKQLEIQRQMGINFEPTFSLPPGYVRPVENYNVESAVYKPWDPDAVSRPLPSWLRNGQGSGSNGSAAAFPSSLPPRPPPPTSANLPKHSMSARNQAALGTSNKGGSSNSKKSKGKHGEEAPPRPAVPRAAAPSPMPPPAAPHSSSAADPHPRPNRLVSSGSTSTADRSIDSVGTAADDSFASARSSRESATVDLRDRQQAHRGQDPDASSKRSSGVPATDRPGSDENERDAAAIESLLPASGPSDASRIAKGAQDFHELAEKKKNVVKDIVAADVVESSESEYEPTYEAEEGEAGAPPAAPGPAPPPPPGLPPVTAQAVDSAQSNERGQAGDHAQAESTPGPSLSDRLQMPASTGAPTDPGKQSIPVLGGSNPTPQQSKAAKRRAARSAQRAGKQRNVSSSSSASSSNGGGFGGGFGFNANNGEFMGLYPNNGGVGAMAGSMGMGMGMGTEVNPMMMAAMGMGGFGFGMGPMMPYGGSLQQGEWNPNAIPINPVQPYTQPSTSMSIDSAPHPQEPAVIAVKAEPKSPTVPKPGLPPLAPPSSSGDVQDKLAKMREAALASMLAKKRAAAAKPVPTAVEAIATGADTEMRTTSTVAEGDSSDQMLGRADNTAPTETRQELDPSGSTEPVLAPLNYSNNNDDDDSNTHLDEPVNFSDSGIMLTGSTTPAKSNASSRRKQVSYADPFPETQGGRQTSRKKGAGGIDIPQGDVDLEAVDATDTTSTTKAAAAAILPIGAPPSATRGVMRFGRLTAADFFEGGAQGGGGAAAAAERVARAKRVRRGPFLTVPEREQRKYCVILYGPESEGEEEADAEDDAMEGVDVQLSSGEDTLEGSGGSASDGSEGCKPYRLQGSALQKHYLQELDGIVGLLRKGKTPTLAQLRPEEAGLVPTTAAVSAAARKVLHIAIPSPSTSATTAAAAAAAATPPEVITPGIGATTAAPAPAVNAEVQAKLAAYEASLRLMKEEMARYEELQARRKAMEIAKRRRAAASSESATATGASAGNASFGENAGGVDAAVAVAEEVIEGKVVSEMLIVQDENGTAESTRADQKEKETTNLELSPGSETQDEDGEEYIPDHHDEDLTTAAFNSVCSQGRGGGKGRRLLLPAGKPLGSSRSPCSAIQSEMLRQ
ncbi:hypothetical protein V8E36_009461 [Tilletia maclaganii]